MSNLESNRPFYNIDSFNPCDAAMNNTDRCPFGEKLQRYWDKRYELFSKFDEGIQIDETALFSVTPEENALHHAKRFKDQVIVDGFGCVGGNAIAFAQFARKVYMIEIDKDRLEMAKNNAEIYGVKDKIQFIHGDYFEEVPNISADSIFVDPPWGGPGYEKINKFKLDNFSPNGEKVLDLAFKHFPQILMRIPKNFDFDELQKYNRKYDAIEDFINDKLVTRSVYFNSK